MAKTIWIRALPGQCVFTDGKMEMELLCGHYHAVGDYVCEEAVYTRDLPHITCFTKGMVNSSLTALVQIKDGWAPLGRISSKFGLRRGVGIQHIVNDFSRDGDIECVRSREDAEKLCLADQKFPGTLLTLYDIAKLNHLDVDKLSTRSLRALKTAVETRLAHNDVKNEQLVFDGAMKTLILAGKGDVK